MLAECGSGALVVLPVAHDQSLVAVRVCGSGRSFIAGVGRSDAGDFPSRWRREEQGLEDAQGERK